MVECYGSTKSVKKVWRSPRIHVKLFVFTVLATLAAGCAPTQQYAQFARAGTVYSAALDRLLVVATNTAVDATSERLLQDDKLINQTLASYKKLSIIDEERLTIISGLRSHARLLTKYFHFLSELATADAPERAQQAIGGVVNSLNALGTQLRGSTLVQNKAAFTAVTKVVVGFAIRGLLSDEINKRKDTIQIELKTQEELLKALAGAIQHDLRIINQAREQRLVIDPLTAVAPISKPDEWLANRRVVLTSQTKVSELESASEAAGKLREAFEDLIAGKLGLTRINNILTDLESILAVVEAIKP